VDAESAGDDADDEDDSSDRPDRDRLGSRENFWGG
jgi:hypothetical protein